MSDSNPAAAIIANLTAVTAKWTKQRKAEEREASRRSHRDQRMLRSRGITIKEAAYALMEQAYLAASANGTLPAHARQIMYQARPAIQEETGRQLDDAYFTQTLLPDYITEKGVTWNVAYDERGHFTEPRGETIGLGTLAVRSYLADVRSPSFSGYDISTPHIVTAGPGASFGAILFVEKEGFLPLFQHVRLAERFDLAIMSTKGVSVTAARQMVDALCARREIGAVPLLVLHDFDKAGFSILGTLHQDTRRYSFAQVPKVIDLGLRLADVEELGLDGEKVFDRGSREAIVANLRKNGANAREIKYMLRQRVELNALTSDQLIAFIEGKLEQHGIKKVIPGPRLLAECYRHAVEGAAVREAAERVIDEAKAATRKITVPRDLAARVEEHLNQHPADRWDDAVVEIADAHEPD